MTRPHRFAALVPERWRWAHHAFADLAGYFWKPCPLCHRPFGGHEWRDAGGLIAATPDPDRPDSHVAICPPCTRAGLGELLPYITIRTTGE